MRGWAALESSPTAGERNSASQSTILPSICLFFACQPTPATPRQAQSWHFGPRICPRATCLLQLSLLFCVPMPSKQGSPRPQKPLWPADRQSGQSCLMETPAIRATLSVILCLFHLSALTMCWSSACKQIVRPRFTLVLSLSLLKDSLLLFFSPAELDKCTKIDE